MSKSIFPSRRGKGIETHLVLVTPQLAREWLGRNERNRNLSQSRIDQYARDMKDGRWTVTNQAIGFDTTGRLIDGQHRLHAVIRAGVSVQLLVTINLDPEAQAHVDTGRARTPSDMLTVLDGRKNAAHVAAIARLAVAWDKGIRWLNSYRPTHQEIRVYVNDPMNYLLDPAAEVASVARRFVPMRPALVGFAYYICARIDFNDAEVFYIEQLIEGTGLYAGDPAKTLQKRLAQDVDKRGSVADFNKLAYVITAWNKFRAKEKITRLQAPRGTGWTPDNYPEPQ